MSKFLCKRLEFISIRKSCNNSEGKKNENVVPLPEVHRFIVDCLCSFNVEKEKATIFANCLVESDYRGIYSHGLSRLEAYINDIKNKLCDPNADPVIVKECTSAAAVCGNNGLGAVIGTFCMDLAIKKAKETGIGMVVASGSNHFGINMFYTMQAVKQRTIGLAFTNTSPVMVPTGAKKVCLGTNPISLAAPALCRDSLMIDMATTAVSLGKIEMYRRKKMKIPPTWALDSNGKPTTDPEVALKVKKMMPLGGDVSYKGTAFALLVEVLGGLLSGSNYGYNVRTWGQKPLKPANLGQGFIAIDPNKFVSGFEERLDDLMNYIRKLEPVNPEQPVLVPGDMERTIMKKTDKAGGIIYTPSHLEMAEKLAKLLNVKPLQIK